MKLNSAMKILFEKYKIDDIYLIPQDDKYPIWQKEDTAGRKYWGVSHFWGMDRDPINPNQDLSQLEWDGNELYLEAQTDEEVELILRKAVGILRFWKNILESRYPETSFYVFASYDDGDMLVLDEGELPTRSITLRFWANRRSNTVINFNSVDDWNQPAIIGYCNFAP